ncbi:MAG TPA: ATP-binding protein [Rhodocyclaceae bacterium]|nr:ATP-binding protein [Rhodocyclaceae bacterium]
MSQAPRPVPVHLPQPHHALGVAAMLIVILVVGLATFKISERQGFSQMRAEANHQLDILASAIDSEVTRHASIPSAVELNPDVQALLRAKGDRQDVLQVSANRFLQKLSDHLGGPAIFVLDTKGKVIASSDWIFSNNLLGADLSYMPVLREAVAGIPGRHYAIDNASQEPGYFFALPIRDEKQDWKVVGVAVVKSGLRELERRWLTQEAPALIVDANRIVLFASPPEWRYASLGFQDKEALDRISREQFAGLPVGASALDIPVDEAEEGAEVRLSRQLKREASPLRVGKPYLALSRLLPGTAWRIVVFSDLRPVTVQASTHAALAAAATGCLLLWLIFLSQRRRLARSREEARTMLERANQELEKSFAERTADLSEAVTRLQREVAERQRAEQTLRAAQDELVQAAKLAVLGQMATGITHELSQPLGALRTLSENAVEFMRRGDQGTVEKNLGIIGKLVDRMGAIIDPLKSFARKSPARPQSVDIGQAVANALFLLDQRLSRSKVAVANNCLPGEVSAWCDAIRLEQVLVNLVGNAIDAMADQEDKQLFLDMEAAPAGRVLIRVADNGSGLAADTMERIFEPFFTTKPAGDGLGLGLAISRDIVRDFGGELTVSNRTTGGAEFVIDLPAEPAKG